MLLPIDMLALFGRVQESGENHQGVNLIRAYRHERKIHHLFFDIPQSNLTQFHNLPPEKK